MQGMEMSRAKVPRRVYTEEFKTEAVRLAQEVGITEAARPIGYSGIERSELDEGGLRVHRRQRLGGMLNFYYRKAA
jgi:transposase-like protein